MKKSPTSKEREKHRLKAQLSIREQQFAKAVAGFKRIIEYEGAHLSVFKTEVEELQKEALFTLIEMENIQRQDKRKPALMSQKERQVWIGKVHWINKVRLSSLYGKFMPPKLVGTEDE